MRKTISAPISAKKNKQKALEELECKYLNKYFHFLKFAEDELLFGFKTKYKIKNNWEKKWDPTKEGKGISDFATGAERIVYSLLNGKGIGQPNSAPIGADLFFEVEDAFIHIDLKTVQTRNIRDYVNHIFIGNNQNSYNGELVVKGKVKKYEEACLPHYYDFKNKYKIKETKPCLTYLITILYEENNLEILNMNILSVPNGYLYDIYLKKVLLAGKEQTGYNKTKRKTHSKTVRYNWSENLDFKLLENKKRVKFVYYNEDFKMSPKIKKNLSKIKALYDEQKETHKE